MRRFYNIFVVVADDVDDVDDVDVVDVADMRLCVMMVSFIP